MSLVNNMDRLEQPLLFDGLDLPDGIHPTDFDAVLEFDDRLWLFFEVKVWGKKPPWGQSLAYKRTIAAINNSPANHGKFAVALLAWHNQPTNEKIQLKDCTVVQWYNGVGDWVDMPQHQPAYRVIHRTREVKLGITPPWKKNTT